MSLLCCSFLFVQMTERNEWRKCHTPPARFIVKIKQQNTHNFGKRVAVPKIAPSWFLYFVYRQIGNVSTRDFAKAESKEKILNFFFFCCLLGYYTDCLLLATALCVWRGAFKIISISKQIKSQLNDKNMVGCGRGRGGRNLSGNLTLQFYRAKVTQENWWQAQSFKRPLNELFEQVLWRMRSLRAAAAACADIIGQ